MQAGWQRHQDRRGSPGAGLWHGLSSPHASVNAILGPLPAGSGGPGPPAVNTAEEFPGEKPLLCAAQRWPCPHGTGEGAPVPPQPRHPCRGTRASQEEGNTQLVKPQVLKSRDASSASSSTSHFFFFVSSFFFFQTYLRHQPSCTQKAEKGEPCLLGSDTRELWLAAQRTQVPWCFAGHRHGSRGALPGGATSPEPPAPCCKFPAGARRVSPITEAGTRDKRLTQTPGSTLLIKRLLHRQSLLRLTRDSPIPSTSLQPHPSAAPRAWG